MDAMFPPNISIWYKATKVPKWNPFVKKSVSGKRRSLLFYSSPIWEFSLPIGHMYPWEMELVAGFFNLLSGPHDTFYFLDPMNKQENLVIGTGDGVETEFQLFRPWGYEELYVEYPVYPASYLGYGLDGFITPDVKGFGIPVSPMPELYVDGVETAYTLAANGIITFAAAPAVGQEVTATFYFCYQVAFTDDAEFTIDFYNGYSTTLKLETVK